MVESKKKMTYSDDAGGSIAVHEVNTLTTLEDNGRTGGIGELSDGRGSGSGRDGSRKEGDDGEKLGSEHFDGLEGF